MFLAIVLCIKLFIHLPILSGLATWAYDKKWLTISGAISAVCLGLCYNFLIEIYFPLLLLVGGTLLSKLNKNKEDSNGRNAYQVLANGLIGTICLVLFYVYDYEYFYNSNSIFYIAFLSSFCISITDTFSSEIGKYYKGKTIDIVTFKPIQIGLSGGISLLGTIAGILGACICGIITFFICNYNFNSAFTVCALGIVGMLLDSVLGSLFQAKYQKPNGEITEQKLAENKLIKGYIWCTNNAVNLLSNGIVVLLFAIVGLMTNNF